MEKKGTLETIKRVDGKVYCSYNEQRLGTITRVEYNEFFEENIVYTDSIRFGAFC